MCSCMIVVRIHNNIHPPFGMLLFVTKALTGRPIGEMTKEGYPFLVTRLSLLLAIRCFREIVL